MKRYFFDLEDGGREPDNVGSEMPDDVAAQRSAVRFVGEVLRHEPHRIEHGEMRVNVHDQDDAVRFSVAVRLERIKPRSL